MRNGIFMKAYFELIVAVWIQAMFACFMNGLVIYLKERKFTAPQSLIAVYNWWGNSNQSQSVALKRTMIN